MHNEPGKPMDMELLLRETGRQDNAALPFEDWKASLLQQAAQEDTAHAPENLLAFTPAANWPRGMRVHMPALRQIAIGVSAVAAALLLVVGLQTRLPKGASSAPAEMPQSAMDSAGASQPGASQPGAPIPEAAMQGASLPEASLPEASLPEAAAPFMDASLPENAPEAPAADAGTGGGSAGGGMPENRTYASIWTVPASEAELSALQAVRDAIYGQQSLSTEGDAVQYAQIQVLEKCSLQVLPLNGGAALTLQDANVFLVILDNREASPAQYAVDMQTGAVLGLVSQ